MRRHGKGLWTSPSAGTLIENTETRLQTDKQHRGTLRSLVRAPDLPQTICSVFPHGSQPSTKLKNKTKDWKHAPSASKVVTTACVESWAAGAAVNVVNENGLPGGVMSAGWRGCYRSDEWRKHPDQECIAHILRGRETNKVVLGLVWRSCTQFPCDWELFCRGFAGLHGFSPIFPFLVKLHVCMFSVPLTRHQWIPGAAFPDCTAAALFKRHE